MSFFFRESGLDMPWSGPVLAVRLENEVKAIAQTGNLRIVGPNCLGIICPTSGLNASFANLMPQKGSVAFISQSGAMITSVLDWSVSQKVGFSAVISIGSMLDMDFSSMIFYLAKDPATKSIVLLHGVDWQCPKLPVCCARGSPDQAHHCNQGRPYGCSSQSCSIPHR